MRVPQLITDAVGQSAPCVELAPRATDFPEDTPTQCSPTDLDHAPSTPALITKMNPEAPDPAPGHAQPTSPVKTLKIVIPPTSASVAVAQADPEAPVGKRRPGSRAKTGNKRGNKSGRARRGMT
jgi:hypothetical protein